MPLTLWRSMLAQQWRLIALTAAVLVTVIAFAATIKPLADGKLSLDEAVRFMFLAVPPMLAYAVPFAAGFGTTLAYHRMAQDNEITAAHAGGMSHLRVLTPALLSGLALAGGMTLLNDRVIPVFLTRMERMVSLDLAEVMLRSLRQGDAARFQGAEIHADEVTLVEPEAGSGYHTVAVLTRVAAIETDRAGRVTFEATAPRAQLFIFPAAAAPEEVRAGFADDDTLVRIKFEDAMLYEDNRLVAARDALTPPVALPNPFKDDPKYLPGPALAALADDPDRMNWIDERRLDLARSIASAQIMTDLMAQARQGRPLEFNLRTDRSLRVQASGVEPVAPGLWALSPYAPTGRVEIEEYLLAEGTVIRSSAAGATIRVERSGTQDVFGQRSASVGLTFRLELTGVQTASPDATSGTTLETTTERPEASYAALSVRQDPMPALAARRSAQLLADAPAAAADVPANTAKAITDTASGLASEIDKLGREIISKQHERWAMSAAAFVMVLAGAVTALRLRHAMTLVVYLWSFLPALLTIVLISAGQSTAHKNGLWGLPILWSGVGAISLYTLLSFLAIRRH